MASMKSNAFQKFCIHYEHKDRRSKSWVLPFHVHNHPYTYLRKPFDLSISSTEMDQVERTIRGLQQMGLRVWIDFMFSQ